MANYGYQYDTNPRKLNNEYSKPKKKAKSKTTSKKSQSQKKKAQEQKKQKIAILRMKFSIGLKTVLIFAAFFFILFREAQISETFSKIQSLKSDITSIQKENDQIEISIQNGINQNNIEQAAKVRLGMQKLSPKQTIYITLPKKDYVEHRTEEVIFEEEPNWFENFVDNIKNLIGKK